MNYYHNLKCKQMNEPKDLNKFPDIRLFKPDSWIDFCIVENV